MSKIVNHYDWLERIYGYRIWLAYWRQLVYIIIKSKRLTVNIIWRNMTIILFRSLKNSVQLLSWFTCQVHLTLNMKIHWLLTSYRIVVIPLIDHFFPSQPLAIWWRPTTGILTSNSTMTLETGDKLGYLDLPNKTFSATSMTLATHLAAAELFHHFRQFVLFSSFRFRPDTNLSEEIIHSLR